jgi:Arc/MetJ family transcription regulator
MYPYSTCMKYTLNIDEDLLNRVVEVTGAKTKTEAIHNALREVDRRAALLRTLQEGTGATPDELGSMFDPSSDPVALRIADAQPGYGNPKA